MNPQNAGQLFRWRYNCMAEWGRYSPKISRLYYSGSLPMSHRRWLCGWKFERKVPNKVKVTFENSLIKYWVTFYCHLLLFFKNISVRVCQWILNPSMSWRLLPQHEDEIENNDEFSGDDENRLRHGYEFLKLWTRLEVSYSLCDIAYIIWGWRN